MKVLLVGQLEVEKSDFEPATDIWVRYPCHYRPPGFEQQKRLHATLLYIDPSQPTSPEDAARDQEYLAWDGKEVTVTVRQVLANARVMAARLEGTHALPYVQVGCMLWGQGNEGSWFDVRAGRLVWRELV